MSARSISLRIVRVLAVAAVLVGILTACGVPTEAPPEPTEKPKVAFLMAVSCDDISFGKPVCDGANEAAELYGVDASVSERVEIPDAETAMRDYAERGYALIVGVGFQYGEACLAVSKEYPDTKFVSVFGAVEGPNLVSVDFDTHELAYLAGIVAGSMSKTGAIGYVGGMTIPGVVRTGEGYRQGAESVNPQIEVLSIYDVGWDSVQAGKEATEAMIASGADVFYHEASEPGKGMIQAAGEHGLYAIGWGDCQDAIAPNAVLTTTDDGLGQTMTWIVKSHLEGTLGSGFTRVGLREGVFSLCPFLDAVPQDVRDKVEQAKAGIIDGTIVVEEITTLE